MKSNTTKLVRNLLVGFVAMTVLSLPLTSKACDPTDPLDTTCPPDAAGIPDTTDTPFDGGVVFLVLVGLGYGITKIRKTNKIVMLG
jgi:hypothetical protein